MVDANTPWSLKGVSDEARDYAKIAAADSDTPIGLWLSAVIHAAAHLELSASTPVSDPADDLLARLPRTVPSIAPVSRAATSKDTNTIERAVQIVSDFGFEPEGPARDVDLIEDIDILQAEIDALETRLIETEERDKASLDPVISEIERLRRRLEALR